MARRVFYSFHYVKDNWRASQVRNIGAIEGNEPVKDNDWETVKRGGDKAIEKWINDQLNGRSCTIVLIGNETAGRKWIKYEIEKSWNDGKGLFGIYIHNLKDKDGKLINILDRNKVRELEEVEREISKIKGTRERRNLLKGQQREDKKRVIKLEEKEKCYI